MQIRTHKYAKLAYPLVLAVKSQGDQELESKYRTLALTFPTTIMQSGLAQAIGFLRAKDKEEHRLLLSHLATLLNFNTSIDADDKAVNNNDAKTVVVVNGKVKTSKTFSDLSKMVGHTNQKHASKSQDKSQPANEVNQNSPKGDVEQLHNTILDSNITEYQLLSREALVASGWLKRYTQALLKKKQ